MPNPVRRSTQSRLSSQFRQDQQADDQRQFVAFALSAPRIRQLVQGVVERPHCTRFSDHSHIGRDMLMLYSPFRVFLVIRFFVFY